MVKNYAYMYNMCYPLLCMVLYHECLSLVSVACCNIEVFATGRSPVRRSPTVCVCVSLSVIKCKSILRTYSE